MMGYAQTNLTKAETSIKRCRIEVFAVVRLCPNS